MIGIGKKELAAAHIGRRALTMIARGSVVFWEALRNCLAGGWWQNGHGWLHGTGWREKGN